MDPHYNRERPQPGRVIALLHFRIGGAARI
jgi:hypothetical protein